VDLPLLVATCDGEIGEETFWQEATAALADDLKSSERRLIYFLILVMASWDISAILSTGAVRLCWRLF
jgi:nitrate reductase NapE component